jgi:serine/threonine protein kinase
MDRSVLGELIDRWSDASGGLLRPGAHLGRYQLLLPLGYGGMACVWAARMQGRRGFSKLVAVKTLLPHLADNTDFEKMLVDEARIASHVHHPNVCSLYELGEEGSVVYLVMEWVRGDSLAALFKAGGNARAVDTRVAARIVADACAGLHAAHELVDDQERRLEVVHRDVSPHNILLSLNGTVKVADFGVAKLRGQVHRPTRAGEVKGKLAYMAPEQISGPTVDRRADVFAIGCVLYEAITGKRPFRGDNDAHVIQAILGGKYELPQTAMSRGCPEGLAAILERALARQASDRFPTAEQMRVAVEDWLSASGPAVTTTHVAQLVRDRLGPQLEVRHDRVRSAMSAVRNVQPTRPGKRQPDPTAAKEPGASKLPAPIDEALAARPAGPPAIASGVLSTASISLQELSESSSPASDSVETGALPPATPSTPMPVVPPSVRPASGLRDARGRQLAWVGGAVALVVVGGAGIVFPYALAPRTKAASRHSAEAMLVAASAMPNGVESSPSVPDAEQEPPPPQVGMNDPAATGVPSPPDARVAKPKPRLPHAAATFSVVGPTPINQASPAPQRQPLPIIVSTTQAAPGHVTSPQISPPRPLPILTSTTQPPVRRAPAQPPSTRDIPANPY